MVASKCAQNHFISEKYISFKLHFRQKSPLVQLCTSLSEC